jgi:hypothetical protein
MGSAADQIVYLWTARAGRAIGRCHALKQLLAVRRKQMVLCVRSHRAHAKNYYVVHRDEILRLYFHENKFCPKMSTLKLKLFFTSLCLKASVIMPNSAS